MQVRSSDFNVFWLDARHLMGGTGFVVIAGEDLIDCERVVGRREILDSRIRG